MRIFGRILVRTVREAGLTPNDRALRESDLRVLLDVVRAGYDDEPGHAMPSAVLHALAKLIPSASVTFCELDVRDQVVLTEQEVSDAPSSAAQTGALERVFWAEFWNCLFCSYPERTGDLRSVVKRSDFYSRRTLHATAMWADFSQPIGAEHEMLVPLPAPPGHARRILFFRGPADPDFTEPERLAAELLRPHLHAVWQDAELRRTGVPSLTRREWEVLHLVAAGYRNAEIAARLHVSITTVHMHLRNIFTKLGVHTRTAALALAMPPTAAAGIAPPRGQRRHPIAPGCRRQPSTT
jgi:DNA-binding CsgD family transcriptional regulator